MAEENVDYIYLTIPTEFSVVYKKLMQAILDAGINILKECDCNCKNNKNRIIFDCWCAFQSAIAAKKLGQEKTAAVIINYILSQLELSCSFEEVCDCNVLPIETAKGIIEVTTNCDECNMPTFYIDVETGDLYSEYGGNLIAKRFGIVDNNLSEIVNEGN